MLFQKFNFNDPQTIARLNIPLTEHPATWDFYTDSYHYAVHQIIEKGLRGNYVLNSQARALLFLTRHAFELCLKENLHVAGISIPLTHELNELCDQFDKVSAVPSSFRAACGLLKPDSDGAPYRYYWDQVNNRPFFSFQDRPEFGQVIEHHQASESTSSFTVRPLFPAANYRSRKNWWDLTFHLGECGQLNNVRTQYDQTLEFLVEGVINDGWDVSRLYLPMMFLIRHSLELALKFNISRVQQVSALIKQSHLGSEHSLATLFNIYRSFIDKLDVSTLTPELQVQLADYKQRYAYLNEQMHNLDTHSRSFRFPVGRDNVAYRIDLNRVNLIALLEIYYYTDPFITFTNDVLEDQGLIVFR